MPCVIRIAAPVQYKSNCQVPSYAALRIDNTISQVGFHPTTISLLRRGRKPTCNIALSSATLQYVIRIVTTGQPQKMNIVFFSVVVSPRRPCTCLASNHNAAALWWDATKQSTNPWKHTRGRQWRRQLRRRPTGSQQDQHNSPRSGESR